MSEPRDHHVVPRMHLKWFAKEGWLNRYQVCEDRVRAHGRVSLKKATTVTDLNRLDDWYAEHTRMESTFGKIEGHAARALAPVLRAAQITNEWPLSNDARNRVSNWLALQHLRTPRMRQAWDRALQAHLARPDRDVHVSDLLDNGTLTGDPEQLARWERVMGVPRKGQPLPRNAYRDLFVEHWPKLSQQLFAHRWMLVVTPTPAFFTSDNPLVLTRQEIKPETFFTNSIAIADYYAARFSWIALSRTHALITHEVPPELLRRNLDAVLPPHPGQAGLINAATMMGATLNSELFQHPDDRIIDDLQDEESIPSDEHPWE
ncbi:hypothetical protein BH09ACT6_BH09ACT6_00300 [soil metagenome]